MEEHSGQQGVLSRARNAVDLDVNEDELLEGQFFAALETGRMVTIACVMAVLLGLVMVFWLNYEHRISANNEGSMQFVRLGLDAVATVLLVLSRVCGSWVVNQPLDIIDRNERDELLVSRLLAGSVIASVLAFAGALVALAITLVTGNAVDFYVFASVAAVLLILAAPTRRSWESWIVDFEVITQHRSFSR